MSACSYRHLSNGSNTPCSSQAVLWEDFLQGSWEAAVTCCSHHNLASNAGSAQDEAMGDTEKEREETQR